MVVSSVRVPKVSRIHASCRSASSPRSRRNNARTRTPADSTKKVAGENDQISPRARSRSATDKASGASIQRCSDRSSASISMTQRRIVESLLRAYCSNKVAPRRVAAGRASGYDSASSLRQTVTHASAPRYSTSARSRGSAASEPVFVASSPALCAMLCHSAACSDVASAFDRSCARQRSRRACAANRSLGVDPAATCSRKAAASSARSSTRNCAATSRRSASASPASRDGEASTDSSTRFA